MPEESQPNPSRRDGAIIPGDQSDPPEAQSELVEEGFYAESLSYEEHRTFASLPLPPAGYIEEWEELVPGTAELIVSHLLEEQKFRHELGRKEDARLDFRIKSSVGIMSRGQWMAFSIAMTAILGGIILIGMGRTAGGLSSIISSLVTLTIVFLGGKVVDYLSEEKARADSSDDENSGDDEI